MPEIAPETRELLDQHPWEDTIPRLVRYALKKAGMLYWQGILGGHLPGGEEAKDVVHRAIGKVISGQRRWDPKQNPDLLLYLRDVVDSELSNLVEGWENRNRVPASAASASPTPQDCEELLDSLQAPCPTPEESMLRAEDECRAEEFFWGFYESLDDKPRLRQVVEAIFEDLEKPAEIAERIGVTPEEIYNIRKQLARRLQTYRAKARSLPREGGTTRAR